MHAAHRATSHPLPTEPLIVRAIRSPYHGADVVEVGADLTFVGGVATGYIKPSPFLCLILKLLQIQPDKEIIVEYIRQEDFKYLSCLGAMYMRLVGTSVDCYKVRARVEPSN